MEEPKNVCVVTLCPKCKHEDSTWIGVSQHNSLVPVGCCGCGYQYIVKPHIGISFKLYELKEINS